MFFQRNNEIHFLLEADYPWQSLQVWSFDFAGVLTSDRVNSPLVSLCIAMARPGEADLAASMAEVNVTVDARQQALRALKGWQTKHPGITTSEQMVKLYLATKALVGRVTPNALGSEIDA